MGKRVLENIDSSGKKYFTEIEEGTTNVLTLDNTTAFTPDNDYEPATKKYVDDTVSSAGGYTDENAQDAVGAMVTGNTETGITVTYDDATAKLNFNVASQTDNNFTNTLKTKLDGIASGAEVNVNADWNAVSGDAQILNKPTIPSTLASLSDDATHRVVTDTEKSTWNAKEPAITKKTGFNLDLSTTATDIKMNGTQSLGVATTLPRADHVHPSDTSKVSTSRTINSKALSSDVVLTTADIADSTDKRYCTDAQKTVISNTSGTNTGDQNLSGYALKNNVLEKDNTTAYEPTAQYHPATKGFVETTVESQIGSSTIFYEATRSVVGSTATYTITDTTLPDTPLNGLQIFVKFLSGNETYEDLTIKLNDGDEYSLYFNSSTAGENSIKTNGVYLCYFNGYSWDLAAGEKRRNSVFEIYSFNDFIAALETRTALNKYLFICTDSFEITQSYTIDNYGSCYVYGNFYSESNGNNIITFQTGRSLFFMNDFMLDNLSGHTTIQTAGGANSTLYVNYFIKSSYTNLVIGSNTSLTYQQIDDQSGTTSGDVYQSNWFLDVQVSSIVGISGTKAQFNTACTDGNFLYSGDITQYTDEMAQDTIGGILTDTQTIDLIYNDASNTISADIVHQNTQTITLSHNASGIMAELNHQNTTTTTIGHDASGVKVDVNDGSITYAKIQNVSATDRILGRDSAGAGVVEEITPANLVTMLKNDLIDAIYPVNSIYMTISSTNPGTTFGRGTWVAWGSGRVPVGVSASDTEFDTVEETGGSKTQTLTSANLPSHDHATPHFVVQTTAPGYNSWEADIKVGTGATTAYLASAKTSTTGSGTAHNNLQPYITCYMWKRTA